MGLSRDDIGLDLVQRTAAPTQGSGLTGAAGSVLDRQAGSSDLGIQSKGPVSGANLDRLNEPGAFATSGQSLGEKNAGPDRGGPENPANGPGMQNCHGATRSQTLETQGLSRDATPAKTLAADKDGLAQGAPAAGAGVTQPGIGTQVLDWVKAHPVLTTALVGTALAGGTMLLSSGSMLSNLGTVAKIMAGTALLGGIVSMLMPKKEEKKAEEKGSVVGALGKAALLGAMNPVVGAASMAQSVIKKSGT